MPITDTSSHIGLSVALIFGIGIFGLGCWVASKPREDIDRWQLWRSNRRTPAGRGWEQLTGLDGAIELGHVNGTANRTTTATARNTAHGTTHATPDDTTVGAASSTAAGTLDGAADPTAVGNTDITARGAASGPH